MTPVLLIPILAVLVGPEQEIAPPRLGIPPTHDQVVRIAASSDSFLLGYQAGLVPMASSFQHAVRRASEMVPSPAGNAIAIASDGARYLALYRGPTTWDPATGIPTHAAHIALLDERGVEIRRTLDISGFVDGGKRSAIWTGQEYVVVWRGEDSVAHALRVSRDGFPLGSSFRVITGIEFTPFIASNGSSIVVAAAVRKPCVPGQSCYDVHLVAIDQNNRLTTLHVMHPGMPAILDFVGSNGVFFLLVHESIPGTSSQNLYWLSGQGVPFHMKVLEPVSSPGLIEDTSGAILYGSENERAVAEAYGSSGEQLVARVPIFETGVTEIPLGLDAARRGDMITFAWSEHIAGPEGTRDAVVTTIDAGLSNPKVDGVPDGVVVMLGASSRRGPDYARAGESRLIVWREALEGSVWIAGALMHADGSVTALEVSPRIDDGPLTISDPKVAANGSNFLVAWTVPGTTESALRSRVIRADGGMNEIVPITEAESTRFDVEAHADGFVVVWEDPDRRYAAYAEREGHTVLGVRIDREGPVVDTEPVLLAGPSASEPVLASNGEHLLLVWTDGSRCAKFLCLFETSLDVKGRIFSSALAAITEPFVVAHDRGANEIEPAVTASANQFLVAWTAARSEPRVIGNISYVIHYADVGHAIVSSIGSVSSAYVPTLKDDAVTRNSPDVAWTGKHFILAAAGNGAIALSRITLDGLIEDDDSSIEGSEPALGPDGITYSRVTPERLSGAAPQVFMREIYGDAVRRRAAGR